MYENPFMKKLFAFLLIVIIATVSFNCQKEISGSLPRGSENANPVTASLQGTVLDENGLPATGVSVKAGSKIAITDAKGYFRIANAPLDKYASMVTAEKTGYFKAIRTFNATSGTNQVMIKMIKKISAGTIQATAGGEVSLSNGAKVSLPANGVMNAQTNTAYTGNVTVFAYYIDPTVADLERIIPGSLLATDKDNKKVILTSYGMMAVELASASGEKLQVAPGKTATLTTPIPASIAASAPPTISLWYVDEQTGLWKEEGQATKNGAAYTGEVKHFSYWNCDAGGPTVNFSATIKDWKGTPLTSTYVRVRPAAGYGASAHGYTDTLGQVSGPIPANASLILEVFGSNCYNAIYSQNIGPYSSNINLGTIVIPASNPGLVTIEGKLLNCTGAPVTNGYAQILYANIVRYCPVNSTGDFSTVFATCGNVPSDFEIYGIDKTTQQQSSVISYPVSLPLVNTGAITACGVSTVEYINYTIDGTNYTISSSNGDPLMAYSYNSNLPVLPVNMWMNGVKLPDQISFTLNGNTSPGSYPVKHLSTQTYQRIAPVLPMNAGLTNYPALVGDYYEGSFSGQFRDSANLAPLHTINCSFRLKRVY